MRGYDLFFDDFAVGDEFATAGETITESQIIDFAMMWDPQPFHTNLVHERTQAVGGLIASGFHTVCMTFRQFLGDGVIAAGNLSSPGMDKLRWHRPVRPGDTLRVVSTVIATRASRSKPDRGTVTMEHVTLNQDDEVVFSCECVHMLKRRDA